MNPAGRPSNISNISLAAPVFPTTTASSSSQQQHEVGETRSGSSQHSTGHDVPASQHGLFTLQQRGFNHPITTSINNNTNNIFAQSYHHHALATTNHNAAMMRMMMANNNNHNNSISSAAGGDIQNERIVRPDFSIFASSAAGAVDMEPLPMSVHRNPQHQAALQSMLNESVSFLMGDGDNDDKKKKISSISNEKKRKRDSIGSSSNANAEDNSNMDQMKYNDPERFRAYQAEQWDQRLDDLFEFRRIHGHCSVPYDYPQNPTLARWVKRQRYQYKLFKEGQNSAMTERRLEALEAVGFVWDTYTAAWERRISELRAYQVENGNCNVPATYRANKKLAAWVKCQRRQYKLFQEGKPNTLTEERIGALNRMGFHWEMRSYRSKNFAEAPSSSSNN